MSGSTLGGFCMRRIGILAVLMLLGFAIVQSTPAHAGAQETANTDISPAQLDQCIGSHQPPPRCTFDANGNLIFVDPTQPGPVAPSFPNLWPILFLMLVWSVVPFVIAISIARSRNEPVTSAVLLILVLGWVGLLIVVYGQRRAVADVGRLVQTPAPPPRVAQPSASTADRLRTIEDLHTQGLITDVERDRRRSAILDSL